MAIRFSDALPTGLRWEPVAKRIRASAAGRPVIDTLAGRLVWEPDRVVPTYAVPEADVAPGRLRPQPPQAEHTAPIAQAWALALPGERPRPHAAWAYADADLAGHLALRWDAFDAWFEEDEKVFGHPRDPFHRVDMRASTRHVRVSRDGLELAESTRPLLVFETGHPVRHYLPREDVRMDLLEPSPKRTVCAYKGFASYFHVPGGGEDAWTYADPLPDHAAIGGLVCFFAERLDIHVDGADPVHPVTQWSPRAA